ncbi:MAG: hypothetical protein SH818_00530 [Saprospiraceae bacterium]|nr:hypothetical protein [Saprospiraceae bacterium]
MQTPEGPVDLFWAGVDPASPYLDEETLVHLIESRVEQLLSEQPDLLWSFLYRLDVEETKIQYVLANSGVVALDLARLILRRQQDRLATQKKYKSDSFLNTYDWGDL